MVLECGCGQRSEVYPTFATQRSVDAGIDYCRRKVLFVRDKTEELSKARRGLAERRAVVLHCVLGLDTT